MLTPGYVSESINSLKLADFQYWAFWWLPKFTDRKLPSASLVLGVSSTNLAKYKSDQVNLSI